MNGLAKLRKMCIVRTKVLWILGVMVLALSIGLQSYVSLLRWSASRINAWNATVDVDLSKQEIHTTKFMPIVSREHSIRFTMRAPLRGYFAKYQGKNESLPPEEMKKSLNGENFRVSWQLLDAGKSVTEGVVSIDNLKAWVLKDHIYYSRAWGVPILSHKTEYTLVARVEQAALSLNEFGPKLMVWTWSTKKGHLMAGWRLSDTIRMVLIGVGLLTVAVSKHLFGIKRSRRETGITDKHS